MLLAVHKRNMNFDITLLGLNHRTAAVDVRERFALTGCSIPENWGLPCVDGLAESLILSTCNRVEMLGIARENSGKTLLQRWAEFCQAPVTELSRYIYEYHNLDAVRHVFEVASSLDSMVLGEPQILGQLKAAYRNAVNAKSAGSILHCIMHKAFFVAKRVRNETAVAASAVSISYAAVELAKRIFGTLPSHRAMLVGAGEMAELAASHLAQAGIKNIIVLNRTLEKAKLLASRFNGDALPIDEMFSCLEKVDIVISSTGSNEPILKAMDLKKVMRARRNRPLFLIDIAVPRDIEPAVNELDNVYLYDIDDLKEVVEENRQTRQEEAGKARLIVEEEVQDFGVWLENRKATPTILELQERGREAASKELARALKKLGPINSEQLHVLEAMANGIATRLNHAPITWIKGGSDRISTIRDIFSLDDK